MGACEIGFSRDGKLTSEQIKKEFEKVRKESTVEYGSNRYSGQWNAISYIEVKTLSFDSQDKAWDYCAAKCDKGDAMAVQYKDFDQKKFDESAPVKKLKDKIRENNHKLQVAINDSQQALKNTKSKTIACGKCESRINREYLREHRCPVCGDDLRPKTTIDKIKKMYETRTELNKQLEDMRFAAAQKSGATKWLVFGLAPS